MTCRVGISEHILNTHGLVASGLSFGPGSMGEVGLAVPLQPVSLGLGETYHFASSVMLGGGRSLPDKHARNDTGKQH